MNERDKERGHLEDFVLSSFAFILYSFQMFTRMLLLGGFVFFGSICLVIPLFWTNQALFSTSGGRLHSKPIKYEG